MKNPKQAKVSYILLFLLGMLFWVNAGYQYIHAGYNMHAVSISSTLIFGIIWPVIAINKLYRLKKQSTQEIA